MQIQPPKRFSSSQSSTAGSANAAGGSIVARSTGCRVASIARGSSSSLPFVAAAVAHRLAPRSVVVSAPNARRIDLVVNCAIHVRVPVKMEVKPVDQTARPGHRGDPLRARRGARAIQARARAFTEDVLIPLEEEAERRDGRLPDDVVDDVKREAIAAGPDRRPARPRARRPGLDPAAVGARRGAVRALAPTRSTGTSRTATTSGSTPSPEHAERWLEPLLRGEIRDAYAVTERDAGSDPCRIAATAEPHRRRLPDQRREVVRHLRRRRRRLHRDGERDRRTASAADAVRRRSRPPGDRDRRRPRLHPHATPTGIRRSSSATSRSTAADVIGGVGGGDDLQRSWFMEERLGIAARCVGAMWRLLDETSRLGDRTASRAAAGSIDYQGVSFPLADSAADAAAGRLLTLTVAALADAGADPKLVHNKASMAKLFTSEAAWRCADRCVQAFGGRGYLRSNVAERLLRELRVDRIWEGTSEIQRLIVARGLERRGVERMLH